jgi:hypothetical protein
MWTKPCKDMGKELHGGSPLFRETQRMISVAGGEWEEQKLPSPPPFNFFSLSCDGNVATLQRAFLTHLLYAMA